MKSTLTSRTTDWHRFPEWRFASRALALSLMLASLVFLTACGGGGGGGGGDQTPQNPAPVTPAPASTCGLPEPIAYVPGQGGTLYEVGPGKTYTTTHDLTLHKLKAGDVVRIYAKANQAPYFEKLYIAGEGTADNPIVVVGIPDAQGHKPVFSGVNATANTHFGRYYYNEDRQVIAVGQSGQLPARNIIVDNLEITGAVAQGAYLDTQGRPWMYGWNAAGLMVQTGYGVTLRRCDIHHNENGIFGSINGELTVEYCYIHENGVHTGSDQEHNLYINGGAGSRFILQYCHIGEELNDGQQVKSRAETAVIRYNWIEGGRNSLLDLVEDKNNGVSDAYVYGNVLIKVPPVHNKRMVFFGADINEPREGTLYFFNNTVINLLENDYATLFMLNRDKAKVIADNNIIYSAKTSRIRVYDPSYLANATGSNNWISSNTEQTQVLTNSIMGTDPGFVDFAARNLFLAPGSAARDVLTSYLPPAGTALGNQYLKHLGCESRPNDGRLDLGAFE